MNPVVTTVTPTNNAPTNAMWTAIDNQIQEVKVKKPQYMILYITIYFPSLSLLEVQESTSNIQPGRKVFAH
jgi:hypothetical protein